VNPDSLVQVECILAALNPTMDEVAQVAQQRPAADLAVPFLRAQDVVNGARFGQIAQDLIDGKPPVDELDDEDALADESETGEDSTVTEPAKRPLCDGKPTTRPSRPRTNPRGLVKGHESRHSPGPATDAPSSTRTTERRAAAEPGDRRRLRRDGNGDR
jgi:hypothetical protein